MFAALPLLLCATALPRSSRGGGDDRSIIEPVRLDQDAAGAGIVTQSERGGSVAADLKEAEASSLLAMITTTLAEIQECVGEAGEEATIDSATAITSCCAHEHRTDVEDGLLAGRHGDLTEVATSARCARL